MTGREALTTMKTLGNFGVTSGPLSVMKCFQYFSILTPSMTAVSGSSCYNCISVHSSFTWSLRIDNGNASHSMAILSVLLFLVLLPGCKHVNCFSNPDDVSWTLSIICFAEAIYICWPRFEDERGNINRWYRCCWHCFFHTGSAFSVINWDVIAGIVWQSISYVVCTYTFCFHETTDNGQ